MPSVGIFLFLILLLLLIGVTLITLFKLIATRNKVYSYRLLKIWAVPVVIAGLISYLSNPIDKNRIVGRYEVDTGFYPGPNARWQKDHFRFDITQQDDFILYEKLADGSERQYVGKVHWSKGEPPIKWSIDMNNPHHIIDMHPLLYRGNGKFYYVFRTKYFGNMFFRKIK